MIPDNHPPIWRPPPAGSRRSRAAGRGEHAEPGENFEQTFHPPLRMGRIMRWAGAGARGSIVTPGLANATCHPGAAKPNPGSIT